MLNSENRSVRRVTPTNEDKNPNKNPEEEMEDSIPENESDTDSNNGSPVHHTIGNTVTHWFGSFGTRISNGVGNLAGRFGVPKTAMSVILAVCLAGGGAGAAAFISNNNSQEIILRQVDYEDDCADEYNDAVNKAPASDNTDVDAQQLENAEKLWAFGKIMGMTDEQCAGMLGNLERESGLDPTEIESVYETPYIIDPQKTPKKYKLSKLPSSDMDRYVPGEMKASYGGLSIKLSAYYYNGEDKNIDSKYDNHYYCGIGLVQWTGPTAARLVDNAEKLKNQGIKDSENNDIEWWNMEYQVAHMITSEVDGNGNSRFQNFLNDTGNAGNIRSATASWSGWMEAGKKGAFEGYDFEKYRLPYAKKWYAKLSSRSSEITKKWSSWVDGVVQLSEVTTGNATGKHAAELDEDCESEEKEKSYDNSDLARAAVAYAWEWQRESYNDGTALYKAVHKVVLPAGDPYFKSCDRGVATAVRWSNADDNFPAGPTGDQYDYLRNPTRNGGLWEEVGSAINMQPEEFEPGDILIITPAIRGGPHGHILMYVSNDIIKEKYPDIGDTYEVVQASLNDYSPMCEGTVAHALSRDNGYLVYRYTGNYEGTVGDNYVGNDSGTSQ